jgi:hypothetical protein
MQPLELRTDGRSRWQGGEEAKRIADWRLTIADCIDD